MPKIFHITAALFSMSFFAGGCFSQSASKEPETASLCSLQQKVTEGNHETVQVSGIFSEGLERGTLEDAACPKESTWVELDLRSEQNKEKLRKLLGRSRRAYVVVEGEFYGPPLPDSKLPEAIRKSYHPGWGHLAAFKTKLVVHSIRDVKAAPTDQVNKNQQSPQVTHADMPLYPPIARVAHIAGRVQVWVTVIDGTLANTEVTSSAYPILVNAALENLKTWKFWPSANATFRVTYIYEVEKEGTPSSGNPRIEMQLPHLVKITAPPPETTVNYELAAAEKPAYPQMAIVARIFGTVEVQVTVKDGVVVNTEVKSPAHQTLVKATTDNIKSWRFVPDVTATFTTRFIYQLEPTSHDAPSNPKIELQLPTLVKITGVPVPLDTQTAYSAKVIESTDTVDTKTGNLRVTIPLVATTKPSH